LLLLALAAPASAGRTVRADSVGGLPVVKIPAGSYRPLYAAEDERLVQVGAFRLMTRPVTNAEFLAFVQRMPAYRRDQLPRVFADERYLGHWDGHSELGSARPSQPVTHVSWFAARAFCESKAMRLPTEAEWERVAAASRVRADGTKDTKHREAIMAWYAKPREQLPDVPFGPANYFGVHDMHGVAWEWVEDFNNAVAVSDSREQGESAGDRFCGAGVLAAQDATDYATFMRIAMRSALEASYTGALLTFRCALEVASAKGADR
jgi:formylglycine-generating enzyme required for sulfatase activity